MAPKPKNPIDDIAKTVGGWLGGGAKALDTFLTGDRNPTFTPTTRQGIRALQEIGDVTSGGAVAAMQQGPDAVTRYVNTQVAIAAASGAVGAVAPVALSKAARTTTAKAIARGAGNVAFQARMLKPMTKRQSIKASRPLLDKMLEMRGQMLDLQDELHWAKRAQTGPDYDYMDVYAQYNPTAIETQNVIEMMGEGAVGSGRQNKMLMDAASRAYRDIDPDWNAEEIRFAKRFLRERGKSVKRILDMKQTFRESLTGEARANFEAIEEARRQKRFQRMLDLSNARRNMPENFVDPGEFFK